MIKMEKEPYCLDQYLNTYKDVSFSRHAMGDADYLLFSILSYARLEGVGDIVSFGKFCDIAIDQTPSVRYGTLAPKAYDYLKLLRDSRRYKELSIRKYTYIVDESTQFGAIVFEHGRSAMVSFTGSDGTIIGWLENLRCSYSFPIYSQIKAKEYLLSIIDEYDEVILLGHSKGGNLAISSALGLKPDHLKKIKAIYNFDGQGFFTEVIESEEYGAIEEKIVNYIPRYSYIGSLMYHGGRIKYIKTTCRGIDVHFQFNWILEDDAVLEAQGLSIRSERIHTMTTKGLEKLDREELRDTMENAIGQLEIDKTKKLRITIDDLLSLVKLSHENEMFTRKEIRDTIKAFLFTFK